MDDFNDFNVCCREFVYCLFFWLSHILVKRVGYGLMGFYGIERVQEFREPNFNGPKDLRINDLDHLAMGTIILFLLRHFFSEEMPDIDWFEQIEEHLVHEVGEVQRGDTPNNGTTNLELKEKEEFMNAESLLRHFPLVDRNYLKWLYLRNLEGRDFCKMVDRICFVWGIGWLEKNGVFGDMEMIPGHPEHDQLMVSLAKSTDPFLTMFVDFLIFSREFKYREVFIKITEEMYFYVNHESMPEHIKKLY